MGSSRVSRKIHSLGGYQNLSRNPRCSIEHVCFRVRWNMSMVHAAAATFANETNNAPRLQASLQVRGLLHRLTYCLFQFRKRYWWSGFSTRSEQCLGDTESVHYNNGWAEGRPLRTIASDFIRTIWIGISEQSMIKLYLPIIRIHRIRAPSVREVTIGHR